MNYEPKLSLSLKDLQLLIECERQMDAGEVPWVYVEGSNQRATMTPEIMEVLKLQTGQTISWFIFTEICKLNLQRLEQQLAYERGQKLVEEEEGVA